MGNANMKAPPTEGQVKGLQVGQILASLPSVLGALYICQHVLRSRHRRSRTFCRILLGMSGMDLLYACISSFSTVVLPSEMSVKFQFAKGNWASCEAFGFLGHGSSLASALYNGSLTLYYLLTIRYSWSERRVKKVEPWLHLVPLVIGWGTAVPGVPLELYNPTPMGCVIEGYPSFCDQSSMGCIRGENVKVYKIAFLYGWVWLTFLFLLGAMMLIYHAIAKVNQHNPASSSSLSRSQFNMSSSITMTQNQSIAKERKKKHKKSSLERLKQQFAVQSMLYCTAFCLTWAFSTTNWLLFYWLKADIYMPLVFLQALCGPMQGFWNAFIYIRPKYLRHRREQKQQRQQQQRQEQEAERTRKRWFGIMPAEPGNGGGVAQAFIHALGINAKEDEDDVVDMQGGDNNIDGGEESNERQATTIVSAVTHSSANNAMDSSIIHGGKVEQE